MGDLSALPGRQLGGPYLPALLTSGDGSRVFLFFFDFASCNLHDVDRVSDDIGWTLDLLLCHTSKHMLRPAQMHGLDFQSDALPDLEAWENSLRAAVLSAGAKALASLLDGVGCGRQDEAIVCNCGARMESHGLKSKPLLTILGPVDYKRSGVTLILTPIIANCVSARHCREP